MPLSLFDRYQVAWKSAVTGDLDLFKKTLLHPESVSPEERKTLAESMGFKGPFLKTIVDVATDPTVWMAMWFSRRPPNSGWFTGKIPQRHIGANAQYNGVSTFTSTVNRTFAGTPIPTMGAIIGKRKAEAMKVARPLLDEVARLDGEDHDIVSLLLEGVQPQQATTAHRAAAGRIAKIKDEMWEFVNKSQVVEGGLGADGSVNYARSRAPTTKEAPRFIRNFVPHVPLSSDVSHVEISSAKVLDRMGKGRAASILQSAGQDPKAVWSVDKAGQLASDFTRWQDFLNKGGNRVFGPRMFNRKRFNIQLASTEGQELFVTNLRVLFSDYVERTATTYANFAPLTDIERRLATEVLDTPRGLITHVPTAEPPIVQVINHGINSTFEGGVPVLKQRQIAGTKTVIEELDRKAMNPHVMASLQHQVRVFQGQKGEQGILQGNLMGSIRKIVDESLPATNPMKARIEKGITALENTSTPGNLDNSIANFFYSSTLGLNVRSVLSNSLQPFLTTVGLGLGPVLRGYAELGKRLPTYAKNFSEEFKALADVKMPFARRTSVSLDRAYQRAFPELSEAGITVELGFIEQAVPQATSDILRNPRFGLRDLTNFLLLPFTQVERANQINAFFGAQFRMSDDIAKGVMKVPAGTNVKDWVDLRAGQFVAASQFVPTPGSRTRFQAMLPQSLRMLSSFQTKLYNYFTESTIRGAMTDKQLQATSVAQRLFQGFGPRGGNLSAIANTFVAGRVLTEGISNTLGVDVNSALGLLDPLNVDPSGDQFFPLMTPVDTPVGQAVTGLGAAFLSGDWKPAQPLRLPGGVELPVPTTFLPGGVAISRFGRAMTQFQPDLGGFVDDDERLMYRSSTSDLILSSLGIPTDKQGRFRGALDTLHNNRMRIRDLRRDFVRSLVKNDFDSADQVQNQYREEFPDLPPMKVSTRDIRQYREGQNITSVQRLLKTLPLGGQTFLDGIDQDLLAF